MFEKKLSPETETELTALLAEEYEWEGTPFLNRYFARCGEGYINLFAISKDMEKKRTRWFDLSKPFGCEQLQALAEELSPQRYDVYFSTCIAGKAKHSGRIAGKDVTCVPALFMDIDTLRDKTKSGKHLPATCEEVYEKLQALRCCPSEIVCSGQGVHAYWLLREPMLLANDAQRADAKRLMQAFARMVAMQLGYRDLDIQASEPARVLRVPRTVNWKEYPRHGHAVDVTPYGRRTFYDVDTLRRLCSGFLQSPTIVTPTIVPTHSSRPDAVILKQIESDPRTAALWKGDLSAYADNHSRADYALCVALAKHTGADFDQMDRLFRQSGLYREKWDELRGERTYGAMTMEKAATQTPVQPLDLSDPSELGTANRFAARYEGTLLYARELGWLQWRGDRWVRDADDFALQAMISLAEECYRQALAARMEAINDPATEATLKNVQRMRSKQHMDSALKLARSLLLTDAAKFDADPYALNTPAGVVNLRDGTTALHTPQALHTHCTAVSPTDPGSGAFLRCLDLITQGDAAYAHYIQLLMGMMAYGRVSQENLIIAQGEGSNGKSTVFNAAQLVLGSYSTTVDPEILQARPDRSEITRLHMLKGARLVLSNEVDERRAISAARMKRLTSTDRIEARRLYHDSIVFSPSHTLVLVTNFLPELGSLDHGTWRRVRVLPFIHQIPHERAQTNYAETLFQEDGGGILRFILEGAKQFAAYGFKIPEEKVPACVREATARYRDAQNWVGRFLEDCCVITGASADTMGSLALYQVYGRWASDAGEQPVSLRYFVPAIEGVGKLVKDKDRNGRFWRGGQLREDVWKRACADVEGAP